ncbi:hypothetical protein R1sor_017076 [Riccia sorocarpa]|uniref:Uncharacterized protein n=1 Tax=Riccia sorocarpa TaxID=122646 RepID=A0ABD3I7L5_9MARC
MSGCERNYDFGDLINCASGLNRLAALEFGKEGLQLGGKHVKQETIWGKLHPRPPGVNEPDLANFSKLETDLEIIEALMTGLKEAQNCAVLFDTEAEHASTRGRQPNSRKRRRQQIVKEVWFGRVQKIRRTYNGKWGKTRSEIDLLDRPISQPGEGSVCQALFNWYTPVAGNRLKFRYEGTELQWIDTESVITIMTMKMEHSVRPTWHLDASDREKMDQFMSAT